MERPTQLKVRFHTIQGKEIDLFCQGLVARIFQHEVDHLNGQVMWEQEVQSTSFTKRRLVRKQALAELADDKSVEAFYNENRNFILE